MLSAVVVILVFVFKLVCVRVCLNVMFLT